MYCLLDVEMNVIDHWPILQSSFERLSYSYLHTSLAYHLLDSLSSTEMGNYGRNVHAKAIKALLKSHTTRCVLLVTYSLNEMAE